MRVLSVLLLQGLLTAASIGAQDAGSDKIERENVKDRVGIGALLDRHKETGAVTVSHVFKGHGAAQAGLKRSDQILKVDGTEVEKLTWEQIEQLMAGESGTTIKLEVRPSDEGEPKEINVIRASLGNVWKQYEQARATAKESEISRENNRSKTPLEESEWDEISRGGPF